MMCVYTILYQWRILQPCSIEAKLPVKGTLGQEAGRILTSTIKGRTVQGVHTFGQ